MKGYVRLSGRTDSTFRVTGTWTEDDLETPIDLAYCSIRWRIKGGDEMRVYTDDEHAYITDDAAGEFELFLTDEEMTELRAEGLAVQKFDITILFPDSSKTVIAFGDLVIDDGVFA